MKWLVESPCNIFCQIQPSYIISFLIHIKHHYVKLSVFIPWNLYTSNSNLPLTVARLNRSKLPTVCLLEFLQCPINPMQLTVLMCSTAHHFCVCMYVCVCMKKKILREHCFQSYVILGVAIIQQCDKKYGASWCLLAQIDTNEQGLAQVISAVFIFEEWDWAICWADSKQA